MFLPGLHKMLVHEQAALLRNKERSGSVKADPRDAHEAGVAYERNKQQIALLKNAIRDSEAAQASIAEVTEKLRNQAHGSRHLSLAITALEDAHLRLSAHLGPDTP